MLKWSCTQAAARGKPPVGPSYEGHTVPTTLCARSLCVRSRPSLSRRTLAARAYLWRGRSPVRGFTLDPASGAAPAGRRVDAAPPRAITTMPHRWAAAKGSHQPGIKWALGSGKRTAHQRPLVPVVSFRREGPGLLLASRGGIARRSGRAGDSSSDRSRWTAYGDLQGRGTDTGPISMGLPGSFGRSKGRRRVGERMRCA